MVNLKRETVGEKEIVCVSHDDDDEMMMMTIHGLCLMNSTTAIYHPEPLWLCYVASS